MSKSWTSGRAGGVGAVRGLSRRRWERAACGVVCVVSLLAQGSVAGPRSGPGPREHLDARPRPVSLRPFKDCAQFQRYVTNHALKMVGPYGMTGVGPAVFLRANGEPALVTDAAAAAPVAFSGTNVQEHGVDEPDIVKTDGNVVFAVAQGLLHAIGVGGSQPALLDSLATGTSFGQQLLLYGDRLLLIESAPTFILARVSLGGDSLMPSWGRPSTTLTEIDISDPTALRVLNTMTVAGSYLSARLVGSTVRLVVSSFPADFAFEYPRTGSRADVAAATRRNREIVRQSKAASWLPRYTLGARRGGKSRSKSLLSCRQLSRASEFSGLGIVSVLTLDLSQGIEPIDTDAVMSSADTVYASVDGLYVATQQWSDAELSATSENSPPAVTTAIHKFDVSRGDETRYVASGEVGGYLLNQWSLSEKDGLLRVVSTDAPLWWGGAQEQSETMVTVLAAQDDRLEALGELGGLGRGERVYAVGFIGDLGYVVTFRQVDPLHVVDVSEPTRPVLRGELHVPGYSAYLHPIGEDLLLGIGRDATLEGQVRGLQASIFDVRRPEDPLRLAQLDLGEGWTDSEFDHHAFLYWPATQQALLPLQSWSHDEASDTYAYFASAAVLQIGRSGIVELGRITHGSASNDPEAWAYQSAIRRTLFIGDTLYSISDIGLKASDPATLADRAWVAFPVPDPGDSGAGKGDVVSVLPATP